MKYIKSPISDKIAFQANKPAIPNIKNENFTNFRLELFLSDIGEFSPTENCSLFSSIFLENTFFFKINYYKLNLYIFPKYIFNISST